VAWLSEDLPRLCTYCHADRGKSWVGAPIAPIWGINNRSVSLRDTWAKIEKAQQGGGKRK